MKFGVNLRKVKTGAEVYVLVFQALSLLPALYIYVASGYPYLMTKNGILSTLFDVGVFALPRWEALLLSLIYRWRCSEIAAYFALLVIALAFGLLANRLLKGNYRTARGSRVVLAVLIGGELVFRLLPLRCNLAFGWPVAILTLAIRLACVILILLDLRADRKAAGENAPEK